MALLIVILLFVSFPLAVLLYYNANQEMFIKAIGGLLGGAVTLLMLVVTPLKPVHEVKKFSSSILVDEYGVPLVWEQSVNVNQISARHKMLDDYLARDHSSLRNDYGIPDEELANRANRLAPLLLYAMVRDALTFSKSGRRVLEGPKRVGSSSYHSGFDYGAKVSGVQEQVFFSGFFNWSIIGKTPTPDRNDDKVYFYLLRGVNMGLPKAERRSGGDTDTVSVDFRLPGFFSYKVSVELITDKNVAVYKIRPPESPDSVYRVLPFRIEVVKDISWWSSAGSRAIKGGEWCDYMTDCMLSFWSDEYNGDRPFHIKRGSRGPDKE